MNDLTRQLATAEEWRIKYQVVTAYIDNPVVIANAERAAAWVLARANSTPYTLEQVTTMFSEMLRLMWIQEQQIRDANRPSATEMLRRLQQAAAESAEAPNG